MALIRCLRITEMDDQYNEFILIHLNSWEATKESMDRVYVCKNFELTQNHLAHQNFSLFVKNLEL